MNASKVTQQSAWMEEVATRPGSMTQRSLATVEKWQGGVEMLVAEAKRRNVHLAQIIDDKGSRIIFASAHPITVLA